MTSNAGKDIAARLDALPPKRRRLLEQLLAERRRELRPELGSGDRWPLSAAQRRLWFLSRLVPERRDYVLAGYLRLDGALHPERLGHALTALLDRQAILRARFGVDEDGEPHVWIADAQTPELSVRTAEPAEVARALADRPFDLEREPLLRIALCSTGPSAHQLVLVAHHLICDGGSLAIFAAELSAHYRSLAQTQAPASLAPLAVSYGDYARWEQAHLASPALVEQRAWWLSRLAGGPPAPAFARSTGEYAGARMQLRVEPELLVELDGRARRLATTRFALLSAAFMLALESHAPRGEQWLGTPVATRERPELEGLIGLFVNTVVLRAAIDRDQPLEDFVRELGTSIQDALVRATQPFEAIVEAVRSTGVGDTPLIQAAISLQEPAPPFALGPALEGSLVPVFCERVTLELILVLRPQDDGLTASFEYASAVVDATAVARIAERFMAILRASTQRPHAPLAELVSPLAGPPRQAERVEGRADATEAARLSPTQLAMWMGQRLRPDVPIYNQQLICTVDGPLDPGLLERAFARVVATNDALRTVIEVVDGAPQQRWLAPDWGPDAGPSLEVLELRPGPDLDARAARLLERRSARRFELETSLVDSVLVRAGAERGYWCLTLHHLITDGWSFALILEQTAQAYEDLAAARPLQAPRPSLGAAALRAAAEPPRAGQRLERARSCFRALEPAPLPAFFARRRPVDQTAVVRLELELDAQRGRALSGLCEHPPLRSLTTGMARTKLWLTLVAALVHRLSGEHELCIGVPLHRRSSALAKQTVGALMVVCPIRLRIPARPSFASVAAAVDAAFTAGLRNLSGLDALPGGRRPYDVVLNYLDLEFPPLAGLPTRVEMRTPGHALDTLTVNVHDHAEQLRLDLDLCAAVFDDVRRARLRAELRALIDGCLANVDAPLDPPCSGEHDLAQLDRGAEAACFSGACDSPWAAIEAHAERQGDAVAVIDGPRQLSWAALRRRVRALAQALRARGLGVGTTVCVALPRSLEQVMAVLAVGASGAAYLPIDPARSCVQAQADLAHAVRLGVRHALVAAPDREALATAGLELLTLRELESIDPLSTATPIPWRGLAPCVPRSPAYVMFTSGTSAAPRAVIVELAGLTNHARWAGASFGLGPGERVLQFASLGFDTAVEELFGSLMAGATLVLREPGLASPREFWLRCRRAGVTVVDLPTAYWHVLVREGELDPAVLGSVRLVVIGGERAERDAVARWSSEIGDAATLINTYGPTEATVVATAHTLGPTSLAGDRELPIGRPLPGVRVSLSPFDRFWATAPRGVPAELLIGGVAVAVGYAQRPGLTAARFVPDPHGQPGARQYRSGDRVSLDDDDQLIYRGRADRQLKIRGVRVEPDAIEARAVALPQVRAAALVVTGAAQPAGALLWLFMVAAEDDLPPPPAPELAARLAPPGVPLRGVWLERLPLTARDKLDRAQLRVQAEQLLASTITEAPDPDSSAGDGGSDGDGDALAELRGLWAELLERDAAALTPEADFFALGGHSLLGAMLIARIERRLGVALPLRALFEAPRLGDLARALVDARAGTGPGAAANDDAIGPRPQPARAPLSSTQERLWFLDQLDPGNPTYNIPAAVELRGALDVAALRQAFSALVERHEILRTTFVIGELGPEQRIAPPAPVPLPVVALDELEQATLEQAIDARIQAHASHRFSLADGPLLALELLRCDAARHVLISNLHHIIADGWSVGVLVRELEVLYAAARSGVQAELAPLPLQYADYAAWQRQRLARPETQTERAWWRATLAGAPERLELPLARPRPAVERHVGARLPLRFAPERGRALAELARAHEATAFMAMLACVGLLLARVSGQTQLCVGSPVAGRDRPELEGLIGCFVNTVVLRLDVSGALTYVELLRRVRATCLDALTHASLPFEAVVDELRPQRSLTHQPLFQVMFTFLNEPTRRALSERGALDWTPREFDRGVANRDLTVRLETDPSGALIGHIEYNSGLFDAAQIATWSAELDAIVTEVIADPERSLVTSKRDETRQRRRARARSRREDQRRGFDSARPTPTPTPTDARAVARAGAELFRASPLVDGRQSPLVLEAQVGDLDPRAWLGSQRERLMDLARTHGGLLVRGLAPRRADQLGEDCRLLTPALMDYDEPSTPRTKLDAGVYTSTEYPADAGIMAHHEMAYASHWPRWLWFHCRQVAETGGASPIVDGVRVRERIDAELRERFERLGVCYVRNYRTHLDLPWQRVFATDDRDRVEAACRAAGMTFEWTPDGGLCTRYRSPAVAREPASGALVWFNSAHMFHVCALEPAVRASLRSLFDEAELPRHAYFGDGSPIPDDAIAHIRSIYAEEGVPLRWRVGDLLLLDNMRFAHGREPFTGARELLVTMAEQTATRGLDDPQGSA
ncbi:condensation domain-containing protein [Enhygromyxa salina]|uniref:Linear gramicidin synthase subunit D n=1 Tax=Enhygromyxa salina TaxID=215803 RepID=A0A2S9Y5T1_9BACT|nr:condensation domain-containing protein [Enhygromyxa salina]PRQ00459.1 Linear gramicidin synthase subunit D [Enhygromyxa salina]